MELFGIGIWELLLIILIALIVLGPQDTVRAGRNIGRAVRRFFSSEEWRTMLQASRDIRKIPDKLLEETGLDHPEDIFPSEAEIRHDAGLDELEQNMSQWKADLSSMSKGTDPNTGAGSAQLPVPLTGKQEIRPDDLNPHPQETGLVDLERDMAEWKADLSAWGTSKVIIPIPSASPSTPAEPDNGGDPVASQSAASEPPPAVQDQPDAAPEAQASTTSSPEQEQK
jgi:Sec-independent protein translocase protein TatA